MVFITFHLWEFFYVSLALFDHVCRCLDAIAEITESKHPLPPPGVFDEWLMCPYVLHIPVDWNILPVLLYTTYGDSLLELVYRLFWKVYEHKELFKAKLYLFF